MRQAAVVGAGGVAEHVEIRIRRRALAHQAGELGLGTRDLGPRRIQKRVRYAINAVRQRHAVARVLGWRIGVPDQLGAVADQQVEAIEAAGIGGHSVNVIGRAVTAGQEIGHQRSAGRRVGALRLRVADIGQCGKATAAGNAQPGALAAQIASGIYL
jgi:hypothetical protein